MVFRYGVLFVGSDSTKVYDSLDPKMKEEFEKPERAGVYDLLRTDGRRITINFANVAGMTCEPIVDQPPAQPLSFRPKVPAQIRRGLFGMKG